MFSLSILPSAQGDLESAPRLVVGFASDIPRYMRLADFFIGKPGPGSISEAVQQGLPVIVVDNTWTMPQERYNAQWVTEHGFGVVHDSFRTIDRAVDELPGRLEEFRGRVQNYQNRALFEIPIILYGIVHQAQRPKSVNPPFGAAPGNRPDPDLTASTHTSPALAQEPLQRP